jgi:hypothetical protein
MIIGASDKFNFRELAATLSSAGIAAEINLTHFFSQTNIVAQAGQNTVNAVATAGVNKIVYHQQPNTEDIAAQALGTTIGTAGAEVIGEKLDVERRRLGIYTEAEIMATKREQEEKAVWRHEQQEELRSEQQKQQELTSTKVLKMMAAKRQVAEATNEISSLGELDFSDLKQMNRASQDLYEDWRAMPQAKSITNNTNNKQPFLSSPTIGDSNEKWQQNVNIQTQQSASARILSTIAAQTNSAGASSGYNQFAYAGRFEKSVVVGTEFIGIVEASAALGVDAVIGWGVKSVAQGVEGGLERFGVFGRSAVSVSEDSIALGGNIELNNNINLLRLKRQLNVEQANSIFNESGLLTQESIKKAVQLPLGQLRNPKLLSELSARPGTLSDWGKYSTESIPGSFQMHLQRNAVTNDIYYGMDYKAVFDHQGIWNISPKTNFEYEPTKFNPKYLRKKNEN